MRKKSVVLVITLLVLAALGGCAGEGEDVPGLNGPEAVKTVKIGGIFDMTGATGDVGASYAEGAKAYVEYYNNKISGIKVELDAVDYAYQINRSKEVYDRLVTSIGVAAILGWGTGDTDALKGFITRDDIPYLSGSYAESLANISTCPYNFLVAASYSDQARIVLKWVKENWKDRRKPRVAFVFSDTPFGRSPIDNAKDFAVQIGCEVVGEEVIDLKALDVTSQMLDLQKKKADYVIIQGTSNLAATTLKNAKELGLRTQFIGLNWASDENVIKLAGPAAEGYIGVIPFAIPTDDVQGMNEVKAYLQANGKSLENVNQKFIQGWVSTKILVEAVNRAGGEPTGAEVRAALETMDGFDTGGLCAPVTFSKQSHRGSEKIRLAKVEDGRFAYVSDWISYK